MGDIIALIIVIIIIYCLIEYWKAVAGVLIAIAALALFVKIVKYIISKYKEGEKKKAKILSIVLIGSIASVLVFLQLQDDMKKSPQLDTAEVVSVKNIPGKIYIDNKKKIKRKFSTAELKKGIQTTDVFAYYRSGDGLHNKNVEYSFIDNPGRYAGVSNDGHVEFKKNAQKGRYVLRVKYGELEESITFKVR